MDGGGDQETSVSEAAGELPTLTIGIEDGPGDEVVATLRVRATPERLALVVEAVSAALGETEPVRERLH